jgi:NTE family protein
MNTSGFLHGEKMMNRLSFLNEDIEKIPIAFGCVATNLRTGKEIWIQKGSLRHAIRASLSLPGLLTPVKLNSSHHDSASDWLVG